MIVSRNSKIRRLEDAKGATIGVSQFGSEADTFTRNALATVGLRPDRDVTILQLGGHPQVAAAMVAGKLEVGALAGLAALTAERAGARLLTSAVELKILSPSGTFATTRGYIQRKRICRRAADTPADLSKRCIISKLTAPARSCCCKNTSAV